MDGDCLGLAVGTPGESCRVVPCLSETSQIANGTSHLDSDIEKVHRDIWTYGAINRDFQAQTGAEPKIDQFSHWNDNYS